MSVSRGTKDRISASFTIEGEPLSVCSTRALTQVLTTTDLAAMRDAIRAELDARKDWGPTPYEKALKREASAYGGLCVP